MVENSEETSEKKLDDEETSTSLSDILTRVPKKGWKPDISRLSDAVVDGKFIIPEGERMIIEYTQEPARDTTMWIVKKVFDEVPDEMTIQQGHIRLWDPEKTQYGATNYKDAQKYGLIMKVPDKSKRWTPGVSETLMDIANKKRRRKKKQLVRDEAEPAPVKPIIPSSPAGEPEKKKRGRPKGSKNKSTLEREALAKSKKVTA